MTKHAILIISAIILCLNYNIPLAAQKMNDALSATTTHTIDAKAGLPEGVTIKENKVTLKEGYTFEKVSNSKVNVLGRMRGGGTGVTGSFDCTCNGNNGGCDIITTPTSVSCATGTCKSSCYMITTIPGAPTNVRQ